MTEELTCEHCGWMGDKKDTEIVDFSHQPAHPNASGHIATQVCFCPTCGVRVLSKITSYITTLKARKKERKRKK